MGESGISQIFAGNRWNWPKYLQERVILVKASVKKGGIGQTFSRKVQDGQTFCGIRAKIKLSAGEGRTGQTFCRRGKD